MSKNKGNVLVPVLAGALVIAIAAAGFFFWKTQQNPGQPLGPYKPIPTKIQNQTLNWKTYINNELGYSIQYPTECWSLTQTSSSASESVDILSSYVKSLEKERKCFEKGQSKIEIGIEEGIYNLSGVEEAVSLGKFPLRPDIPTNEALTHTTVAGHDAVKLKHGTPPGVYTTYFIENGHSVVYRLSIFGDYEGNGDDLSKKTIDQILSTFKFTATQTPQSSLELPALFPSFAWQEQKSSVYTSLPLRYYKGSEYGDIPLIGKSWYASKTFNNEDELTSKDNDISNYYSKQLEELGYSGEQKKVKGFDVYPLNAGGPNGSVMGYVKTVGKTSRVVIVAWHFVPIPGRQGPGIQYPITKEYEVFMSDTFDLEKVLP